MWKRKKQEQEGQTYMFDGQGYVTQGVQAELTPVEISYIILNLREYAQQENGIDYLTNIEKRGHIAPNFNLSNYQNKKHCLYRNLTQADYTLHVSECFFKKKNQIRQ